MRTNSFTLRLVKLFTPDSLSRCKVVDKTRFAVHRASAGCGAARPRPHSSTRSASRRALQQTASPPPPPLKHEMYRRSISRFVRVRGGYRAAKIALYSSAPPSQTTDPTNGASEHRPSTRIRVFVPLALSLEKRFDAHLGFSAQRNGKFGRTRLIALRPMARKAPARACRSSPSG